MSNKLNPKTDPKSTHGLSSQDRRPSGFSVDRLVWGPDHHAGRQRRYAFTGPVVDQAALHGLLKKVRDLGMPLVSVTRVEPGQADQSDLK